MSKKKEKYKVTSFINNTPIKEFKTYEKALAFCREEGKGGCSFTQGTYTTFLSNGGQCDYTIWHPKS